MQKLLFLIPLFFLSTAFADLAQEKDASSLDLLHLARISIEQEDFLTAQKILADLAPSLTEQDPLHYGLFFVYGELFLAQHEYKSAAEWFEKAIPHRNKEKAEWLDETLYLLGYSLLKEGQTKGCSRKKEVLQKAEQTFLQLLSRKESEKGVLALAQCYLIMAKEYSDPKFLEIIEILQQKEPLIQTKEGRLEWLLIRGRASSSVKEKEDLFAQVLEESTEESIFHLQAWSLRALNELSQSNWEKAKEYFDKVTLLSQNKKEFAQVYAEAALQLAHSYLTLQTPEGIQMAFSLISKLLETLPDFREGIFLQGQMALLQSEETKTEEEATKCQSLAEDCWKKILSLTPSDQWTSQALYSLGTLYFSGNQYEKAEEMFLSLVNQNPSSPLAGDALFFASQAAEKAKKNSEDVKKLLQKCYEEYPHAPYAAEAFIRYYSPQQYLLGSLEAYRHLQEMPKKFPRSPYSIYAYYLLGMDWKRDRLSTEGQRIHAKDLSKAIEAFTNAEELFEKLDNAGSLQEKEKNYFLSICKQATLERARVNLTIATLSKGTKKEVFCEYAEEVFKQINTEFEISANTTSYPPLYEESEYGLLQCYRLAKNEIEALALIEKMKEQYEKANITRSYYLSRILYEKGLMQAEKGEFALALSSFEHAEEAAKGRILNSDEKLDLWIEQSRCYRSLQQPDKAMLTLSKTINEDAVSQLRLKAMFLRAELYEELGRYELAQRQLEALAKKGGEWALLAKEKLKNEYAF